MKKFLRPSSILFYVLMLLTFFVIGLYYAGLVEAGKNQGLAGGAIVLSWGLLFGGVAFIASFFIAYYVHPFKIKVANWILLATLFVTWGYKYKQFKQRDRLQNENNIEQQNHVAPTESALPMLGMLPSNVRNGTAPLTTRLKVVDEDELGLGFFKPNFSESPTLFFYGDVNLEKELSDHMAYDSLVIEKGEYGDFVASYGPPWLSPHHMKLDYGILYFKVLSVGREFIKVETNSHTHRAAYLNRHAGRVLYWPEFLLSVHSVEFIEGQEQEIKIKPIDHASESKQEFVHMRPLRVADQWVEVLLTNEDFQTVGKGWIRWQKNGKLLITYSLLS